MQQCPSWRPKLELEAGSMKILVNYLLMDQAVEACTCETSTGGKLKSGSPQDGELNPLLKNLIVDGILDIRTQ